MTDNEKINYYITSQEWEFGAVFTWQLEYINISETIYSLNLIVKFLVNILKIIIIIL